MICLAWKRFNENNRAAAYRGPCSSPLLAQDFPTKPITLMVPYAAGGGNDAMARTVADKMGKTLGQQVVVENRAGAGGIDRDPAGRPKRRRTATRW